MTGTNRINCFGCRHFYITWDPNFPRGCKAYGFKSQQIPSAAVLASSGEPCKLYAEKQKPPPPRG